MTAKIVNKQDVSHIAKLSRLQLTEVELDKVSEQLSLVLGHFKEIEKIDTHGVEPLLTPTEMTLVLRDDVVVEAMGADKLLANSPERSGNLFKVPPVV